VQRSGWQASILEELLAICLSDAYTLALIDNGFDWTGTLFEFELDAARDGVSIPHSYWPDLASRRRPRTNPQPGPDPLYSADWARPARARNTRATASAAHNATTA
jgi:hypothetical protein